MLRIVLACLCLLSPVVHADYVQDTDLISLHYDHAPDRDDAHAAVAALMVSRYLGIQPHVVSGAYGDSNKHRYIPEAEKVMEAAWPGIWVNAHSNWNAAVITTADAWTQTLNAGGDIYIAEGGQSDFSADVIRRIQSTTNFDTNNRITLIQHSAWNEQQASVSDLNFAKANSNYVNIHDGNRENQTADLNEKSAAFVTQALKSSFASEWEAAFAYLSPDDKLDFSDTVEYLHIVGIGKSEVATVNDFAAKFFSANDEIIPTPNQPTNWSDSYSVDGQCYCDTTYDHGLRNITVSTNEGTKTVPQVCDAITAKFGTGSGSNRIYYNTVQCGLPPVNNAADETVCPGIPRALGDYTGYRCDESGASWNLEAVFPVTEPEEPPVEDPPVEEPPVEEPPEEEEPPAEDPEPPVAQEFPTCSDAISDTDNDGYGWENNRSCLFSQQDSTDDTQAGTDNDNQPSTVDDLAFALCTAGVTDSDNDGYGWENEKTCVISSDTATTDTPDNSPVSALDLFPHCSEAITDPYNSGYGWENNATCVVADSSVHSTATTDTNDAEFPQFPVCSSTVIDDNNDGYGWENFQTCQFAGNSQPTTETSTPVVPVFATCSASVSDPDGDGYGWENNQTCQFDSSGTDNSDTATDPQTVIFPICSAFVTDTDGDGYGWENDQTCQLDNSATDSSDSVTTPQTTLFPICSAAVSDTDGDGYGWENDQTCQFDTAATPTVTGPQVPVFPTCSASVSDLDGDGYSWENNQTCSIAGTADGGASAPYPVFPTCSDSVIDHDGDGYGWENFQTCQL